MTDSHGIKKFFLSEKSVLILIALVVMAVVRNVASNYELLSIAVKPSVLDLFFLPVILLLCIVVVLEVRGKDLPRQKLFLWFLLIGIFLFTLFHSIYFSIVYDDAYISFRYVKNLLNGHGLVFNPMERVEAYSNFLWVILLSIGSTALKIFKLNLPAVALLFNFLALIGIYVTSKRFFRHFNLGYDRYYFLALLGVNTFFVFWLYSGIETVTFSFLILLGVSLAVMDKKKYLYVVLALLILTRADGFVYTFILIFSLCMDYFIKNRFSWSGVKTFFKENHKMIWFPLGVFLIHVLVRYLYYGFPFPNTYYVKVGSGITTRFTIGFKYLMEFYSTHHFILLVALLLFVFLERKIIGKFIISPFILLINLYFIYLGGDSLIHFRFGTHVIPVYLMVLVLVFGYLVRELKIPRMKYLMVLLLVGFFFIGNHQLFISRQNRLTKWHPLPRKKAEYQNAYKLAIYFKNRFKKNSIALGAVGIIPYIAENMTVIDILGLADLHVGHLKENRGNFHIGHNKWDIPYVLERKPTIIIPPRYYYDKKPDETIRQSFLYGKDLFWSDVFINEYQPQTLRIGNVYYLFYVRKEAVQN